VNLELLLQELDFTFPSGMLHWLLGELAIEDLDVAGLLRLRPGAAGRGDGRLL